MSTDTDPAVGAAQVPLKWITTSRDVHTHSCRRRCACSGVRCALRSECAWPGALGPPRGCGRQSASAIDLPARHECVMHRAVHAVHAQLCWTCIASPCMSRVEPQLPGLYILPGSTSLTCRGGGAATDPVRVHRTLLGRDQKGFRAQSRTAVDTMARFMSSIRVGGRIDVSRRLAVSLGVNRPAGGLRRGYARGGHSNS